MGKTNVIPSMTPSVVHAYLRHVGRSWTGQGVAMELGCWLGASSHPLLEGLTEAGYDKPFYAYDLWTANKDQVIRAAQSGMMLTEGQDIAPIYEANIKKIYKYILMQKGRIPGTLDSYPGEPIEVCVFDAPKRNEVFCGAVKKLLPRFIPGVTVWGLLDYYSYRKKSAKDQVRFMAPQRVTSKGFTLLAHWPEQCSCAFFRYDGS